MKKSHLCLAGDMLETISVSDFSLFTSFLYFSLCPQNNHACLQKKVHQEGILCGSAEKESRLGLSCVLTLVVTIIELINRSLFYLSRIDGQVPGG